MTKWNEHKCNSYANYLNPFAFKKVFIKQAFRNLLEILVLESLFNKFKSPELAIITMTFMTLTQVFSCEIWKREEHLFYRTPSRGSHLKGTAKKGLLTSFEEFTEKHLAWSPATELKRDSSTGVFQ